MERGERYSYFSVLSYEMVCDVFDYLTHLDRKNCRLVCHRWRILLDNSKDRNYFKFCSILDNKRQKPFFNSYRIMKNVTMKNFTNPIPENALLPKFHHAILGWRNLQENIITLLKSAAQNCESITITKFSLGEMNLDSFSEAIGAFIWQKLSKLNIKVILTKYKFERAVTHLEATIVFLKLAKIPNLKELNFDFLHQCERYRSKELRVVRFQNMILSFYEFVAGNAKSLQHIGCSFITTRRPTRWFSIPEIPNEFKLSYLSYLKLKILEFKLQNVKEIESLVTPEFFGSNLDHFMIDISSPRLTPNGLREKGVNANLTVLDQNLSRIFSNNGKSLCGVHLSGLELLNPTWFENCHVLDTVCIDTFIGQNRMRTPEFPSEVVHQIAKTLRVLSINSETVLDLSCLQHCQKLEKVTLVNLKRTTGRQNIEELDKNGINFYPTNSLKELEINSEYVYHSFDEVKLLINRNTKSLEKLIFRPLGVETTGDWFSPNLNECLALNTLEIWGCPYGYMQNVSQLSNLTSFRALIFGFDLNPNVMNSLTVWITKTMPNVETIGYLNGRWIPENADLLVNIQTVLKMPKVIKIRWQHSWFIDNQTQSHRDRISQFCNQTPGLEMGIEYQDYVGRVCWITVDRSVFDNNEYML